MIAHELTHTVQQKGDVQRKIQKKSDTSSENTSTNTEANADQNKFSNATGTIDKAKSQKEMTIKYLKLPNFKRSFVPQPFTLRKKTGE